MVKSVRYFLWLLTLWNYRLAQGLMGRQTVNIPTPEIRVGRVTKEVSRRLLGSPHLHRVPKSERCCLVR